MSEDEEMTVANIRAKSEAELRRADQIMLLIAAIGIVCLVVGTLAGMALIAWVAG